MLISRKPFRFLDDFGYFEDDFGYNATGLRKGLNVPPVNIREEAGAYEIEVAVPGLKRKDFSVSVADNVLTIGAEVETEKHTADKGGNYTCREFRSTSFKRSFSLPERGVDSDAVKAAYRDGILTVSLPKKKAIQDDKPKMITVG
ncbi:MAG: Hsp20/alpha crystallin family protein [Flavobacteriales bacterium]